MNVTLFGNRVFIDIIKLRWGHRWFEWALNLIQLLLSFEEENVETEMLIENAKWRQTQRLEWWINKPRNANEHQGLLATTKHRGKACNGCFPDTSKRAQSSDTLISDFRLPELYTYTTNILFHFFPSILPIPSPYLPKLVGPYGLAIYLNLFKFLLF